LGGLVYWQLLETGSFVREIKGVGVADPVLLLGPSVLLLAVGLIFLQTFPLLLRLLSWLIQMVRGLVLPMGITRLSRDLAGPRRIVLLFSITTGLIFFATVFEGSIAQRQKDIAHYLTGADLRVALPLDSRIAQEDIEATSQLPGILAASSVYRGQVRWGQQMTGMVNWMIVDLFAVDTATFDRVAFFPANASNRPIPSVLDDLRVPVKDWLPVVVSPQALPRNGKVGDLMECQIGQHKYVFQVRGIIDRFPTLKEPFAITDLSELEKRVNLGAIELASFGARELWLSTEPAQHDALAQTLQEQEIDPIIAATFKSGRVAGDAQARLRSFQVDLIAQITTTAFKLNAFMLVVLSSANFLLIQILSARRRQLEFGVLRAMGLSVLQLLVLLALEGLIMLVLGLLIGTGVGYGLAHIMRPFLSLTLASSLGGYAIDQITVHWPTIARLYAGLSGVYAFALALLLLDLMHSDLHRTLRIGDE
jgi:putative ABC transport system permease protein